MSFFKSLANHARKSNSRAIDRVARWADSQDDYHKHGKNCCADCIFFEESAGDKLYYCDKHDFSYDLNEARINKIHYKRTCSDFCGKYL